MSKNQPLSQKEFSAFNPNEHVLKSLKSYAQRRGLPVNRVRVLDWGCGRGRMVLALRERGFDARGVDPDTLALANGTALSTELGYPEHILSPLMDGVRTGFPSGFFDFIFSNQVLEHVQDLNSVAAEISRLTKAGGEGLHIFPPRWHWREAHLQMPGIHWLPKGFARRWLIYGYTACGIESRWSSMANQPVGKRAETYYRYSIERTFYRPNSVISELFREAGLDTTFRTIDNPKLERFQLVRWARQNSIPRSWLNAALMTFVSAELTTHKVTSNNDADNQ